jgi:hypothetical protein
MRGGTLGDAPGQIQHRAAISNGSGLHVRPLRASHVLFAMGLDENKAAGTVRLSWSLLPASVDTLDDPRLRRGRNLLVLSGK